MATVSAQRYWREMTRSTPSRQLVSDVSDIDHALSGSLFACDSISPKHAGQATNGKKAASRK
jgi:hypothetical protein